MYPLPCIVQVAHPASLSMVAAAAEEKVRYRHTTITVEGNIGAGKSTLLDHLAKLDSFQVSCAASDDAHCASKSPST